MTSRGHVVRLWLDRRARQRGRPPLPRTLPRSVCRRRRRPDDRVVDTPLSNPHAQASSTELNMCPADPTQPNPALQDPTQPDRWKLLPDQPSPTQSMDGVTHPDPRPAL